MSLKHVNPLTPQATPQAPVFDGVLRTWAAQLYTTLVLQVSGPLERGYVFYLYKLFFMMGVNQVIPGPPH